MFCTVLPCSRQNQPRILPSLLTLANVSVCTIFVASWSCCILGIRIALGLTGSAEDIAAVAPLFGIYYEKQEGTTDAGYMVNHSPTLMVVDQQGIMRLIIPFNTTVQDIAADVASLLREGSS